MRFIGSKIEHLTDARFFAAALADFISFEPNERIHIAEIKAILPWIIGSEICLETSETDLILIQAICKELNATGIIWGETIEINEHVSQSIPIRQWKRWNFQFYENPNQILETETYSFCQDFILQCSFSYWLENEGFFLALTKEKKIWIETADPDFITHVRNLDLSIEGWVIKGSSEEQVGIKDFDSLDSILSLIED